MDVAYLKDTSWWLEKSLALQELHLTSDRAHQQSFHSIDIGTLWSLPQRLMEKPLSKLRNAEWQYDDNLEKPTCRFL